MLKYSFFIVIGISLLLGCSDSEKTTLKIYSQKTVQNGDSTYQKLPPFSFKNQYNEDINNQSVENKIYVADFFFTTCPTICPRMKSQMLRVYEKYGENPDFKILSHTIDPEHDTVALLFDFADRLGVKGNCWYFLTGDKSAIYDLAEQYMVTAEQDPNAPGGFIHSGAFILVDHNGLIRGFYDGTDEYKVNKLIEDIGILLHEKNTKI